VRRCAKRFAIPARRKRNRPLRRAPAETDSRQLHLPFLRARILGEAVDDDAVALARKAETDHRSCEDQRRRAATSYVVLPFRLSGLHIERVNLRAFPFGVAATKKDDPAVDNRGQRLRIPRKYPGSRRRKRPDNILPAPAARERSQRQDKQNSRLFDYFPHRHGSDALAEPMILWRLAPTHAVI